MVSIITPVYGAEDFIGRCAESLFGQTYADIEYIFVDDCSPDRSVERMQEVLSRYPHRRPQVKVVRHAKNRGVAAASVFFRIAWFIRSICFCAGLHRST